jgi:excisionase family DNA binding protein
MARLLTVQQAGEILGLKTSTIRAWVSRRKLPRVNCGRAVRIPSEAVEEFIRRNTIPARDSRGTQGLQPSI